MNTLEFLRDRLFRTLGFAKSVVGGTLTTVSPKDTYPVFIANEGLGGQHTYDSLLELVNSIPIARLQKGMKATVNQHTAPDGTLVRRTTYVLEVLPTEQVDYISQIPNYDLSFYWKVDEFVADYEGASETQYAPNVDKLSGQAVLSGGGVPGFPGSLQGRKVDRSQYDSLTVGNLVVFNDGIIPSQVSGYWANDYDALKGHIWMRQRTGQNSVWSNPIRIAGEGASAGDYIENRFQWALTIPPTPPMYSGGKPNNEPAGWTDAPLANPNDGSKLWMTKCQKDVYQQILTAWTPPIEIKIDPTLVRYSEKATPNPNDFGSDYVALTANGWLDSYNPNLHRYIARRETTADQWIIDLISGESGEYLEYVFKAFPSAQTDQILDQPDLFRPKDTLATGWADVPFTPTDNEQLFVSAAKKFSNGELKTKWSDPTPFGGQDVIFDYIKSDGGDDFKKNKAGAVTPASISLTALLYKGVNQLVPTSVSWKRIWNGGALDTTAFGTTAKITIVPADVKGHAIFSCTQVYDGVNWVSEYTILDIADGIDAKALVTTANSNVITVKSDGSKVPASVSIRALNSNLTGPIHWYKDGVKILDVNGVPVTTEILAVDMATMTAGVEDTFKAEAQNDFLADGITKMSDATTIYALADSSSGAAAVTMVLSNESHTLVSDEATGTIDYSTASTDIRVFEGATEVTSTWAMTIHTVTNVTAAINNTDLARPIVSVSAMAAGASTGAVVIKATKGTAIIYKQFSLLRIKDPIGAIILDIDSNRAGFSFSPTEVTAKTLTANLYVDGVLKTTGVTYQWSFDGLAKGTAATQMITVTDVEYMTTVKCVATYNAKSYSRIVNVNDVKDARGFGILYATAPDALIMDSRSYPPASWPYNSQGGIQFGVSWTKDSANAIWMSTRKEGDDGWSTPVRIKGEKGLQGNVGNYMKNVFAWASLKPLAPTGTNYTSNDAGVTWYDTPAPKEANKFLWMSQAEFKADNTIVRVNGWSDPVQMNGTDGIQGPPGQQGAAGPAGKVTLYYQLAEPTGMNDGDIWIKP